MFRQTNVIWVAFFLGQLVLGNIDTLVRKSNNKSRVLVKSDASSSINLVANQRIRKPSNLVDLISHTTAEVHEAKDFELKKFFVKLYKEDFWGKKLIYQDLLTVIDMNQMRPYLMAISTFVFFVLTVCL